MRKIPKGKILIRVIEPPEEVKTKSGLTVVTEKIKNSKRYTTCGEGVVIEAGSPLYEDSITVKPGDKIYYQRFAESYIRTIEEELQKVANMTSSEDSIAIITEEAVLLVIPTEVENKTSDYIVSY